MKPDDKITLKTSFQWFGIKFLHIRTLYSICVLCLTAILGRGSFKEIQKHRERTKLSFLLVIFI